MAIDHENPYSEAEAPKPSQAELAKDWLWTVSEDWELDYEVASDPGTHEAERKAEEAYHNKYGDDLVAYQSNYEQFRAEVLRPLYETDSGVAEKRTFLARLMGRVAEEHEHDSRPITDMLAGFRKAAGDTETEDPSDVARAIQNQFRALWIVRTIQE